MVVLVVVTDWYITAYKPILDKDGKIIGVIYVGVNQANLDILSEKINSIKIGDSGFVEIFDSEFKMLIHPDKNLVETKVDKDKIYTTIHNKVQEGLKKR